MPHRKKHKLSVAAQIRDFDWASTALGPAAQWPESLHATIRLILMSPAPILLMCGKQGVMIYNDAYAQMAGERHPRALGLPAEQAWPEVAAWNRNVLNNALRGRAQSFENQHFLLNREGRTTDVWMNLYYSPLFDEQQTPYGLMCIMLETTPKVLTERRQARAEAKLREANERLELALSSGAVIGTWLWDLDGDNLRGDERFAQVFSLDPLQVAHGLPLAHYREAIHPDDRQRIRSHIAQCITTGGSYRVTFRVQNSHDDYQWVEANGFCELAKDGSVLRFPGVLIDIDEQKKTETALRQLTQNLEQRIAEAVQQRTQTEDQLRQVQKMEAIGQLTGGIAHDFNNILAAVLGSLELSLRKLASGKADEVPALLNSAVASTNRGASLTHHLLAFARRQALDMRPTQINSLVESVEELLRRTLGKHIQLETLLTPDPWLICIDAHQLENALLNLVINARDAMPNGGLLQIKTDNRTLCPESAAQLNIRPGDYLCVRVRDDGIGMHADISRHVFEPFFTTKPIGQGTGLGLPMVYGFISQAGGHLQLQTAPGEGTTIDLYLPRLITEPTSPQPTQPLTTPQASGETVLLVEDDPAVRLLMGEGLSDLGYRVLHTTNGDDALHILASSEPLDLLLTDIGLPGMNGWQLAEEARRLRPELPVLFATGYAHDAQARSGNLSHNMSILTKPFSLDQLGIKMRAVLQG